MKKFIAEIDVMPRRELLDPQGKAVTTNIKNLHIHGVDDVRIGKHISIEISATDAAQANTLIQSACEKLLANQIMETFTFKLSEQ